MVIARGDARLSSGIDNCNQFALSLCFWTSADSSTTTMGHCCPEQRLWSTKGGVLLEIYFDQRLQQHTTNQNPVVVIHIVSELCRITD
jgi:hypothetical protein